MAEMLQTICAILLPGAEPDIRPVSDRRWGHNQIVEHSPLLPQGRSFRDAINDIKTTLDNQIGQQLK